MAMSNYRVPAWTFDVPPTVADATGVYFPKTVSSKPRAIRETFDVVICGFHEVGKQSVICRICYDHFHDEYFSCYLGQSGEDDDGTSISHEGITVIALLHRCFMPLIGNKYPGLYTKELTKDVQRSDAVILVYDVTDRTSFKNLIVLHKIARNSKRNTKPIRTPPDRKPIIIMANKCDIPERKWVVKRKEGKRYCERNGAAFFVEASAKTGMGLDKENLLGRILDHIHQARNEDNNVEEEEPRSHGVREFIFSTLRRFLGKMGIKQQAS